MLKVLRFLSNDDAASCIRLSLALVIPRKVIGSQNLTARTVVRVQSFAERTDLEFQTDKSRPYTYDALGDEATNSPRVPPTSQC